MAGRTPQEAFDNYIGPMRQALQCVTRERLLLAWRGKFQIDTIYPVTIKHMDPVPLRVETDAPPIALTVGQWVRIIETEPDDLRGPYKVSTARYFYALSTVEGEEVLGFHWTPESTGSSARTYPHLHVGSINLDPDSPIRPGTFHKVHIPTSRISLEAIIRLAITEFDVRPLRADWETVLDRTEGAFIEWRTRSS